MGKKTPVVVVSEEEENVNSTINNTDEPEPDLNNNTDNTFAEYERAALNSYYKKEHFRRELRDIPITIVFLEKDIITISNKMIREEEEAQGKALKAVETIEENNLFVSGDNTDVNDENRAPSSIQAKGSFTTHKDNEKTTPNQQLQEKAIVEHNIPVVKCKKALITYSCPSTRLQGNKRQKKQ